MNTAKKLLATAILSTVAVGAQAQLAGKNVILVMGFQPSHLMAPKMDDEQLAQNGAEYWSAFWDSRAEARIDWLSTDRIEGGTAKRVMAKLEEISRSGMCNDGCVVVTHSTGDLVTRYLLENQDRWLAKKGLEPIEVVTVLDYAGAGGGTELADVAMNVAYNDSWYMAPMKAIVNAVVGNNLTPDSMGVLNDLQPNYARNLATSPTEIPRLRFVGTGIQYAGVTKPIIKGGDDSVVPLHSACGSVSAGHYESCVPGVAMNGERISVAAPKGLLVNHYPVLMSEGVHHSGVIGEQSGNSITYAYNNFSIDGVGVRFDTKVETVKRPWWKFWVHDRTYQKVRGGENSTMSEVTYAAIN